MVPNNSISPNNILDKIEHINLDLMPLKKVRIGIVQLILDNNFYNEKDGLFYPKTDEHIEKKYKWFLNKAKDHNVNILCFPEISSSKTFKNKLKIFSDKNNMIIIGGSYYNEERKNVCPILIPNEDKIYYSEKLISAPDEKSIFLNDGMVDGDIIHLIENSPFGSIGVLICSDYLDQHLKNYFYDYNVDFLFVISLNRDDCGFHTDMRRDCERREKLDGFYILYSNSILSIKDKIYGNGRSAIFGLMNKNQLKKPRNYKIAELYHEEDILIADFDIENKNPTLPNSRKDDLNIKLIYPYSKRKELELRAFFNYVGLKDKRYKRLEDLYVAPTNIDDISDKLKDNNLVFLVGDPEIGKTYTSIKLLLDSYYDGYKPIYFNELKREKMFKVMRDELEDIIKDKTVIYFEDPWGKTNFNSPEFAYRGIKDLINRVDEVDARVIITSREQIFRRFQEEIEISDDLNEYVEKLKIKIAYSKINLKNILENYLDVYKPIWYQNTEMIKIVTDAINDETLKTPMSIKEVVLSRKSKKTQDKFVLASVINESEEETKIAFGKEILGMFKNKEYEKLVFLSFPFISSSFSLEFIKREYGEVIKLLSKKFDGFDLINAKKFITVLNSFKGSQIDFYTYSTESNDLLKFSHPSYSDGFLNALKKSDELNETIFCNILKKLSKDYDEKVRGIIARTTSDNFEIFPSIAEIILEELSNDEEEWVRFCVASTVGQNFNKIPIAEKLLKNLSQDYDGWVRESVTHASAENFNKFPKLAEKLLTTLSEDIDERVRESVTRFTAENFNKFPKLAEKLLTTLSEDIDERVRGVVARSLGVNFSLLPRFGEKLLTKLSKDENSWVRESIALTSGDNFRTFPLLAENIIEDLSNDEDVFVRESIVDTLSNNFNNFPLIAENLLTTLSEDNDQRVKERIIIQTAMNFNNFPTFAKKMIMKFSIDDNISLKFLVASYTSKYYNFFPNLGEKLLTELSQDEDKRVKERVACSIAEGFNNFPILARRLLTNLSNDDEKVRMGVANAAGQNFLNFPHLAQELLEKLSEDKNEKVRAFIPRIVARNYENFPSLAEKILIKLSNDDNNIVKESVVRAVGNNYIKFPNLTEMLLKKLSQDPNYHIRDLVQRVVSANYNKYPLVADQILKKLGI